MRPALLLLPFVFAPAEQLVYAPAPGEVVRKRFETTIELRTEELRLRAKDKELDLAHFLPDETIATYVLEVRDEPRAVLAGRPTKLARTFDEISVAFLHDGEDSEAEHHESLEERTVLFLWDAEEGAYEREYAGGPDGDAQLLETLQEDLDLRAFLPTGEVEIGDEWSIFGEELGGALLPGLELANPDELLTRCLRGIERHARLTCRYGGDGAIHFSLAVKGELEPDLSGLRGLDALEDLALTIELDLGGRLDWDQAARRFDSLQCEGEGRIEARFGAESEGRAAFEVRWEHVATAEPQPALNPR